MQKTKYDWDKYDFKRDLLFCGSVGTGKTYKANELLKKFADEKVEKWRRDTYSITDAMFKQMIKSNMIILKNNEDWQTSIDKYPLEIMLRCKILLFDDIGVSDISDAYLRDLTFIINERMTKGLVTIYTTNLSEGELRQKLNERIVSRMLDNTDVVEFEGEDLRRKTMKVYKA